jgi:ribosomal protein S19
MYSTYSFLVQLDFRKKALLRLSEPQRIRLFFVIGEHFIATASLIKQNTGSGRGLLRKTQLGLLSVKVYRSSVCITYDCVGLPLSVYSGHSWKSLLVKKGIVGFPLRFFVLVGCSYSWFACVFLLLIIN